MEIQEREKEKEKKGEILKIKHFFWGAQSARRMKEKIRTL